LYDLHNSNLVQPALSLVIDSSRLDQSINSGWEAAQSTIRASNV
jgi:hypothetical protein